MFQVALSTGREGLSEYPEKKLGLLPILAVH
jgi:hypothetical protein